MHFFYFKGRPQEIQAKCNISQQCVCIIGHAVVRLVKK